ncbi:hypothetical protein AB0G04_03865 [Actinoplanes sp. NPDC023801]|uniref:hypothetical protein n=1 Tax=Actinoplanes sp. NPDC023801 TaxID=3154595 RepID=UPI0033E837B1
MIAGLALVRDLGDVRFSDIGRYWSAFWGSSPPAGNMTASFDSPEDGDKVPLCSSLSGTVSGLTGDRAAWLLLKGPNTGDLYYLTRRIIPASGDDVRWHLTSQQIGDPMHEGQRFRMLIIGTEGAATAEYDRAAATAPFVKLPAKYETLADISVTIADDIVCG